MIKDVSIIFISIFFESLPFLILGSLISAIIETFISNDTIAKLIPKNKILGSLVGVFLGFFIPACDCAVIPVSKRLVKKKVPLNVSISFMMASPIINPVVLLSTYYAFYKSNPKIFYLRLVLGIGVSLIIGIIVGFIFKDKEIVLENHACHNHHHHNKDNKFLKIMNHTLEDLFDVLKFLMIGAFIASLFQALLPKSLFLLFNKNEILSILVLMLFAYLVSLCSTSDSFVGKTLLSTFSESSIIAYLLLGPMIDIKNTIVLMGNYNKKFVITLVFTIFIVVFLFSIMAVKLL